jgi:hypothetical protein
MSNDHQRREIRVAEIEKWLNDKKLDEIAKALAVAIGLDPAATPCTITNQERVKQLIEEAIKTDLLQPHIQGWPPLVAIPSAYDAVDQKRRELAAAEAEVTKLADKQRRR